MRSPALRYPLATTLVAVFVLMASPARAFECTRVAPDVGPSLTWKSRQVRWVLDGRLSPQIADRDGARAAIEASFDTWSKVPCSDFEFILSEVRDGATAGAPDGGPYENVVTFISGGWVYDKEVIALTTTAFDNRTGQILDADIEINEQHFQFSLPQESCARMPGNMDLQNTLTHEVGHVVGLDHPPIDPRFEETTMYASAPPCEIEKRSLADDDMAALCAIYPLGRETQPCFAPEGPDFVVIDSDDGLGCASAGSPPFGALLLVLGLGVVRARRRRGGAR